MYPDLEEVKLDLELDNMIRGQTRQGLADHDIYRIRVKAKDSRASGGSQESSFSDAVNLIDNPLLTSGGKVYVEADSTTVKLVWHLEAARSNYQILRRPLGTFGIGRNAISHKDAAWAQDRAWPYYRAGVSFPATNPGDEPVTGLTEETVHAFQLNFESGGEKFFSARDAYAWVSPDQFPGNDERVATFPFFGHHGDRVYRYAICDSDFPTSHLEAWKTVIQKAMEEWQAASGGLVQTTRQFTGGCLTAPLNSSPSRKYIQSDDANNEIRMLDLPETGDKIFSFPEFKSDVFKVCLSGAEVDAYVTSFHGYAGLAIQDAVFREELSALIEKLATRRLPALGVPYLTPDEASLFAFLLSGAAAGTREAENELEGVDITFKLFDLQGAPKTPHTIKFNTCMDSMGTRGAHREYVLALHEIGHALGLSGFDYSDFLRTQEQPPHAAHPTIPTTVMNYNEETRTEWFNWWNNAYNESDCSPHPFDILALYSLYQKAQ